MHLARALAVSQCNEPLLRFEVTVVTQTPGSANETLSDTTFDVVRRPKAGRLWRLIRNADTVLLAGPAMLPLLFALILRRRTIVSHHGYQSICPNGMLFHFPSKQSCPGHFAAGHYLECVKCNAPQDKMSGSARLLALTFARRALSRLAHANVAVSQHVSERIALPRTVVIPNGVPTSQPLTEIVCPWRDGTIRFAYIGRLVTEKGINVLIDAARILRDRGCQFEVLIIGDGPERQALETQAASLQLAGRVEFLGFLSGNYLQQALSCVSAVIMPSICEDAAPFSALEQMMQGRLIIGSKIGGLAEEIGEAGLTFIAGSAPGLADQMQRVIQQPELIPILGRQAFERALKGYTLERMITEYRDLLAAGLRSND
jgi:glycosyltransferase involved in cell wall biosynthesis